MFDRDSISVHRPNRPEFHMEEVNAVHHYRTFSLEVESQLAFPELRKSSAAPQVAIRFGSISGPAADSLGDRYVAASQNEAHLYWKWAGSFLVRAGKEIVIDPVDGATGPVLRLLTLGPAFAVLLQQLGHLVLHASAVVIGGKAVAFVGWKGQGKSTTAATLFARGCPLLTDDLLVVNGEDEHQPVAHPGFPQFKLWPDSAEFALAEAAKTLPKLMPNYDKRIRTVTDGFALGPAPLAAIYVLEGGPELTMHRLVPQEAFLHVVRNTFCARYGKQLFAGALGAAHLESAARVTASVPVFRFERPKSLERLDELAEFVVNHATHL
jgi:hypothetical protein